MKAEPYNAFQIAIGLVFLLSCLAKVGAPREFRNGLVDLELFPRRLTSVVAGFVICIEGLIAITHITGLRVWETSIVSLVFLASLGSINTSVLVRGGRQPCLCFSPKSDELMSGISLARIGMLFIAETTVALGISVGTYKPQPLSALSNGPEPLLASVLLILSAFWILQAPAISMLLKGCRSCAGRKRSSTNQGWEKLNEKL